MLAFAVVIGPTACGRANSTSESVPSAIPVGSASASVSLPMESPAARPFRVAAYTRDPVKLRTLGKAQFAVIYAEIYRIEGGRLRQDMTLHKGATIDAVAWSEGWNVDLMGSWPDAALLRNYAVYHCCMDPCEVSHDVFRWTQDHWAKVDLTTDKEALLGVSAPSAERALALIGDRRGVRIAPATPATKVALKPQPSTSIPAAAAPWTQADAGASEQPCRTAMQGGNTDDLFDQRRGQPILALPGGDVFVVGKSCPSDGASWLVEHFAAGDTGAGSKLYETPALEGAPVESKLVGRDPRELYLAVPGYRVLKRFDGSRWVDEQLPADARVNDLEMSEQGTLWLALKTGLFKRPAGGTWRAVGLDRLGDAELTPRQVSAPSDDAVWVYATAGQEGVILGPPQGPKAFVIESGFVNQSVVVASDACEQPYAMVAVNVDEDKDRDTFPEVERRLRGLKGLGGATFGVVADKYSKQLVAALPNMEVGRAVVQAMRGYEHKKAYAVPDVLMCGVPTFTRTVQFEVSP